MDKQKKKNIITFFKFTVLLIILIGLPLLIYFFFPSLVEFFKYPKAVDKYILQYKAISFLVYILLQVMQVIISLIPGEVIQIAGGYLYGIFLGTLFSVIGIGLGSLISFYFSRFMGRAAVMQIFGEKRTEKFTKHLNSKRARIVVFILFLIPALPKDLIVYAAGISDIDIKDFLTISMMGRIPALVVSMVMGKMLRTENFQELIIVAIAATAIFGICVIFRKKVLDKLEQVFDPKQ